MKKSIVRIVDKRYVTKVNKRTKRSQKHSVIFFICQDDKADGFEVTSRWVGSYCYPSGAIQIGAKYELYEENNRVIKMQPIKERELEVRSRMFIKIIGKQFVTKEDQMTGQLHTCYIIHFIYEDDHVDGQAVATKVIGSHRCTPDAINVGDEYVLHEADHSVHLETAEAYLERIQPEEDIGQWRDYE